MTGHEAKALLERFVGFLEAQGIDLISCEDNGDRWETWPKAAHDADPLITEFVLQAAEIR